MARPVLTPEEEQQLRSLLGKAAADWRWAFEPDRSAATKPGRDAFMAGFEDAVDPDGTLPPEERAKRAANLRRAHFTKLAIKSAKARAERASRRKESA
jgi:hypothetical protein